MAEACNFCRKIDFHSLFFNDFVSFSRFLPLVTDLEDDEYTFLEDESAVVARDRADYLEFPVFDGPAELQLLHTFLDSIGYAGDRALPSLNTFFEQKLYAPLSENDFAYALGTISELRLRAQSCRLCAWLSDHRVWRLPADCDAEGAAGNHRDVAAVRPDWQCYILPIWPSWKSIWRNINEAPNELYVLPVPKHTDLPLLVTDDGFYVRDGDLRTIALFDNACSLWKGVPPLIEWPVVKTWIHQPLSTAANVLNLGKTQSSSFMLIDVNNNVIVTVATLSEYRYAALSYVWGQAKVSEPWCQDIQRIHDRDLGKPVPFLRQDLPATIQGALQVCAKLSIQYLWVDSLCIAQNVVTKMAQAIADMGHIYMGAYLCIIAAADRTVHQPLPGVDQARSPHLIRLRGVNIGITPPRPSDAVKKSIWCTRGWTFQEAVLPEQSLIILPDQIVVQSARSLYCESATVDLGNVYESPSEDYWPEPLTTLSLYEKTTVGGESGISNLFSIYKDMVGDYSRRQWSNPIDADNAFQGLSVALSTRFNVDLEYALPVKPFAQSLNWTRYSSRQSLRQRKDQQGRLLFPSYSWLSTIGQISYITLPRDGTLRLESGFEEMPATASKDARFAFPASGFETHFATQPHRDTQPDPSPGPQSTTNARPILVLSGAIAVTSKLHPLDLAAVALAKGHTHPLTPSTMIDAANHAGYYLDDLDSLPAGQLYLMPIAFYRDEQHPQYPKPKPPPPTSDLVAVMLIVQLWTYPHASPSSWPLSTPVPSTPQSEAVSPASTVSQQRQQQQRQQQDQAINHILTAPELQNQVFLARRVGIRPYGFFPVRVTLPVGSAPPEIMAKVILA